MITAPTQMQSAVMSVPANYNLALCGGRGGGKSVNALFLILAHVQEYGENASVLAVRRTLKSLADFEDSLLGMMSGMVGTAAYSYNRNEKLLRFNGAKITLASIDDARSYDVIQGRSFSLIFIDEYTQFPNEVILRKLRSNLRAPEGVPTRVIIASNPGGPGHSRCYLNFVKDRRPFAPYTLDIGDGETEDWVTCNSTYLDNEHVDAERYLKKLKEGTLGNEALRRQWINGEWTQASGRMFPDFDRAVHVVDLGEGYQLHPDNWTTRIAVDWGISAPSIALWCSKAKRNLKGIPVDSVIVLSELTDAIFPEDMLDLSHSKEWPPYRLSEAILDRTEDLGVPKAIGVVDDARGLQGESLKIEMMKAGQARATPWWSLTSPKKGRRSEGYARINSLLAARAEDNPGRPHLIFSDRCKYLITTIERAMRDENNPDEIADSVEACDHAIDALRYGLAEHQALEVKSGRHRGMYY